MPSKSWNSALWSSECSLLFSAPWRHGNLRASDLSFSSINLRVPSRIEYDDRGRSSTLSSVLSQIVPRRPESTAVALYRSRLWISTQLRLFR